MKPSWQFTLSQSVEKQHDKAPDFSGEAQIGPTLYDVAAWFGEIHQGQNLGHPYLGLQFQSKGNASQKVSISLWEKVKRKSDDEPHFKTRELFNGQEVKFSARIEPAGQLYRLAILIEPFSPEAGDLSEAALVTHQRLQKFVDQARLRLTAGEQPSLPQTAASSPKQRYPQDPDLDAEPGDIPF